MQGWSPLPLAPRVFRAGTTSGVITGLTNAKIYRFKVKARYNDGNGPASVATNAVRVGTPASPLAVSATAHGGKAVVHWKAPRTANGSPILGYVITPYRNGRAQGARVYRSPATTETVGGLTSGNTYRFRVAATNSRGTGPVQAAATRAIRAR
jgi:large repetitive protein